MSMLSNIPTPIRWIVGVGLVIALGLMIWFGVLTKAWNGIGNFLFHREASEMSQDVKDQLAKAAEQKKVLEQTLLELAKSKEELAKVTQAREDAEKIFDDKSKTATQKLAAYEAAMSAAPIHTDPGNVSTEDLCARAKAAGTDQSLIDILCQSSSQEPDPRALVTSEVQKQLHDSKILFNPPLEMQQGAKERIEARVSFDDIGPALREGLQGVGAPQVEHIKVSRSMKVVLVGDHDAFLIETFGSEVQEVAGKPFAQWEWDVTPLRSGNQTLHLQASAIIHEPEGGEKAYDKPVIHKTIQVKVGSWYATKRFVGNNWQWLWTALFIPLGGWLWQRKRKKTRRPAGFR